MTANELPDSIVHRRRSSQDRLALKKSHEIRRQLIGRGVTTRSLLFECPQDDPVEIAPQDAPKSLGLGLPPRRQKGEFLDRRIDSS